MTQAVKAKINPEIREMLLGHKIGIASSYYRPTEQDMQLESKKLIEALTINPENRLKRKVEKSQFDKLAAPIRDLEKRLPAS